MKKEIVYIADLDQDIDDVLAAHYLNNQEKLKCVVCDPYPTSSEGIQRKNDLENIGIEVRKKMPPICKYVFVGGALTLVADYITTHHIDWLVMNGGFVGDNISTQILDKFKGKKTVRTYNFNCDCNAAHRVLMSSVRQIGNVVLVGKNVCHSRMNTRKELWNIPELQELFDAYKVREDKRLHDILACHEGLAIITDNKMYCDYDTVKPFNNGLNGRHTEWGSTKTGGSPYRDVYAATGFSDDYTKL